MNFIIVLLVGFSSWLWPMHFQNWGSEPRTVWISDSYDSGDWVRTTLVSGQSHLMVMLYAWDEKNGAMHQVRLADDGGLDVKGGQTVYVRWMYEGDAATVRVRDLERRVRDLETVIVGLLKRERR